MNVMERDGWTMHILAADARTVLLGYRSVRDQEMLLRIVAKLHGDVAEVEENIRRWGRAASGLIPSAEQCKGLGIRLRLH
jgi:hypothetical protein